MLNYCLQSNIDNLTSNIQNLVSNEMVGPRGFEPEECQWHYEFTLG